MGWEAVDAGGQRNPMEGRIFLHMLYRIKTRAITPISIRINFVFIMIHSKVGNPISI